MKMVVPMLHRDLSVTTFEGDPGYAIEVPEWPPFDPRAYDPGAPALMSKRIFRPEVCGWRGGRRQMIYVEDGTDREEILPAAAHWLRFGDRVAARLRWLG